MTDEDADDPQGQWFKAACEGDIRTSIVGIPEGLPPGNYEMRCVNTVFALDERGHAVVKYVVQDIKKVFYDPST